MKKILFKTKQEFVKNLTREETLKIFEDIDRDLFIADIKIQSEIEKKIRYWKRLKQVKSEVTKIKRELKNEIIKS